MERTITMIALLIVLALFGLYLLEAVDLVTTSVVVALPASIEHATSTGKTAVTGAEGMQNAAADDGYMDADRLTIYVEEKNPDTWMVRKTPGHKQELRRQGMPLLC
ncbi:MAG: hypothetical protein GXP63_00285 [DPANN group archaeon]|nr:hypothetical protein [DPANN group archaeon]